MRLWIVFCLWLAPFLGGTWAWAQFRIDKSWVFGSLDADDALKLYENRQTLGHFKDIARGYLMHNLEQMQNLFQPLNKEMDLFYSVVSAILNETQNAEAQALLFIRSPHARSLIVQVNFYLGLYYFNHDNYKEALKYLEKTELSYLDNSQVMALKFCQAYAYFVGKEFVKSFVLFDAIRQVEKDNLFFNDASYYFAFLHLYLKKNYAEAIFQLRRIQRNPFYANIVPYYIAYLMYLSGQRSTLITYIQGVLPVKGLLYKKAMVELLGYLYFEKRDYAKVIQYFVAYKELSQSDLSRNDAYLLGYSYYQINNLDSATHYFRQVTVGYSDALFYNATYNLGNAYLRQGKKIEARTAFVQCMSGNPNAQEQQNASFLYAKLSLDLGFVDVALSTIKRYIFEYPKATDLQEARDILVLCYANGNNYKEAVRFMEQIPGSSPPQIMARVYYGRAVELMHDENKDSAMSFFDKAISNRSGSLYFYYRALFWKAQLLIEQEQYPRAIALLEKTLNIPDRLTDAEVNTNTIRYNIGNINFVMRNYKQALVLFVAVMQDLEKSTNLSIAPKQKADLWIKTADCYFILRQYKNATNLYHSIISSGGKYTDYAAYQLALLEGINSAENKNRDLQEFLAHYPNSDYVPLALLELGKSYLSRYVFDSSAQAFEKLLNHSRANNLRASAWLNLGIIALQQDKKTQAIKYFTDLLNHYPNSPEAQSSLEFFKDAYVSINGIDAYFDYLKNKGYAVSVGQEDSLYYENLEERSREGAWTSVKKLAKKYLQNFPTGFYRKEVLYILLLRAEAEKNDNDILQYADSLLSPAYSDYKVVAARTAAVALFDRLRDYVKSLPYLRILLQYGTREDKTHALQALLMAYYNLGDYTAGYSLVQDFAQDSVNLNQSIAPYFDYFRAEHKRSNSEYLSAVKDYENVMKYNRGELAAVASHKIALMYFLSGDLAQAEKKALEAVKEHSSYELWIIETYLLLGQIYERQKDYFNAKATYKSIMENTSIDSLQKRAGASFERIRREENEAMEAKNPGSNLKTVLDTGVAISATLGLDSVGKSEVENLGVEKMGKSTSENNSENYKSEKLKAIKNVVKPNSQVSPLKKVPRKTRPKIQNLPAKRPIKPLIKPSIKPKFESKTRSMHSNSHSTPQ